MSDGRPLWVEYGASEWRAEYTRAADRALLGHHEMLPGRRFYTDAMLRAHIRGVLSTRGSRARGSGEREVLRWLRGGVFSDRSWSDTWGHECSRLAVEQWAIVDARADIAGALGRAIDQWGRRHRE